MILYINYAEPEDQNVVTGRIWPWLLELGCVQMGKDDDHFVVPNDKIKEIEVFVSSVANAATAQIYCDWSSEQSPPTPPPKRQNRLFLSQIISKIEPK